MNLARRVIVFLAVLVASSDLLHSALRAPGWPALRRAHLAKHPACAVCGATSDREVHHIKPFTLFPDLEMDPKNLVTLCRSKNWGFNCHLRVGHGGNYSWYNPYLISDIAAIRAIRAKYKTFTDECQEEIEDYLTVIRKRVKKYNSRPYEEMKKDPVSFSLPFVDKPALARHASMRELIAHAFQDIPVYPDPLLNHVRHDARRACGVATVDITWLNSVSYQRIDEVVVVVSEEPYGDGNRTVRAESGDIVEKVRRRIDRRSHDHRVDEAFRVPQSHIVDRSDAENRLSRVFAQVAQQRLVGITGPEVQYRRAHMKTFR